MLWERPKDDRWLGTSDNYIRVVRQGRAPVGLQEVRLGGIVEDGVEAEEIAA